MDNLKYVLKVDEDEEDVDSNYSEGMFRVKSIGGWFALDSEGKYCEDKKYIKYLHTPPSMNVKFDLTKSHVNDVHKPQEKMKECIDELLMWVTKHSVDESGKPKLPNADFISFRGLLSRIMWTPYEKNDSLMICAVRLKGTTYLCMFATEENKANLEKMDTDEMKKFTRYGYKFEQYMLSDEPGMPPDTEQPLSELEEVSCIFNSQVGKHELLYGAEVDGFPDEEALSDLTNARLVELKTCKENPAEYSFTRFKLLKWWVQSSLANISSVIVGYRDDNGIVNKLEEIKLTEMPTRAKNRWDPKCCVVFLNDFLNFVKYTMKDAPENDPNAVYKFVWNPRDGNNSFVGTKLPVDHQCNFIPQWYTDWLNSIPQ